MVQTAEALLNKQRVVWKQLVKGVRRECLPVFVDVNWAVLGCSTQAQAELRLAAVQMGEELAGCRADLLDRVSRIARAARLLARVPRTRDSGAGQPPIAAVRVHTGACDSEVLLDLGWALLLCCCWRGSRRCLSW